METRHAGEVITQVNNQEIDSAEGLDKALSAKDVQSGVRLQLQNNAEMAHYVFITPNEK